MYRLIAEVPELFQAIDIKGTTSIVLHDGTSYDAPGSPDLLWIRLAENIEKASDQARREGVLK